MMNELMLGDLYSRLINFHNSYESPEIFRSRILEAYHQNYLRYGLCEMDKFFDTIRSLNYELCMKIASREYDDSESNIDTFNGVFLTAEEAIGQYGEGLYFGLCSEADNEEITNIVLEILSSEKNYITITLSEEESIILGDCQNVLIPIYQDCLDDDLTQTGLSMFDINSTKVYGTNDLSIQERRFLLYGE